MDGEPSGVDSGPHKFRPLRPWDLRRNGRCSHCYLPRWAHPVHCWVPARPLGSRRRAEVTWENLHGTARTLPREPYDSQLDHPERYGRRP